MINCVIIEDEIAGQQILLSKISKNYPECEVLEIIDNKEQAVAFLNNNKVDLDIIIMINVSPFNIFFYHN